MITVSTVSPDEAEISASALQLAPRYMGFEVYLRGKLFASRQPVPGSAPEHDPPEELR